MSQPTASEVHVNASLTNVSVASIQDNRNFVAGRVFPNVPVDRQSDRYFTFNRGDFNRNQAGVRAPAAESAGGGFDLDNTPTYFANVHAIHQFVPDVIVANADAALNLEEAAAVWTTQQLLIEREVDWVEKFFTGGLWTNDYDGVSGTPGTNEAKHWSDQTAGTPIEDIRDAKTAIMEATGTEANTLVMGRRVFDALSDHPDIVDRIKYSGGVSNERPAIVTESALAQVLGVDRVMVANAIQNTAAQGQTATHSFIAGRKALLCHAAVTPGLMTPTAGYTFSWRGYLGTTNEFGMAISRIRNDDRKAWKIEGEMAYDQKLVSADHGFFWDNIVAAPL